MGNSDEIHGLLKIPDSVLLKEALIENGKLQAYILELEDQLKNKKQIEKGSFESLVEANRVLKQTNKRLNEIIYKRNETIN